MKQQILLNSEDFDVEDLSIEESKEVNGGAGFLVALAAVSCGLLVGAAIGALLVYGAYCVIKQLKCD
jgi:hypothetical protein